MLLTKKDKDLLLGLLKKENRRVIGSKKNKADIQQLIEKFEQSMRNEKVNKVNASKL